MRRIGSRAPRPLVLAERLLHATGLVSDVSPRIVNYHSIGVDGGIDNIPVSTFRAHIRWLSDRYRIVPLDRLLDGTGRPKRVAITFDDGLVSFWEHALPVLDEFDVPATVFVIGAVAAESPPMDPARLSRERLTTADRLMDEETLSDVARKPLVDIGAHSMTHPELPTITDAEILEREVIGSKETLEAALNVRIDSFSYPYNHWSEEVHRLVASAFEYGVHGWGRQTLISALTDRHLLPRINGGVDPATLRYQVSDLATLVNAGRRTGPASFEPDYRPEGMGEE